MKHAIFSESGEQSVSGGRGLKSKSCEVSRFGRSAIYCAKKLRDLKISPTKSKPAMCVSSSPAGGRRVGERASYRASEVP